MCGIAGVFHFKSQRPADGPSLVSMRDTMVHRGPDDAGIFLDGPCGLAHRRLSILDLSPRGHQPMASRDGRFVVSYNGEIYNYLEIKDAHFRGSESFVSQSDTEVLLEMYSKLGPECLSHFNGMFAFAIWDRKERSLFIARDRLGKKPLYYAMTKDGIAFASELKALLKLDGLDKGISEESLLAYMALGYAPGDRTVFAGIRKLAAGHQLLVKDGVAKEAPYWKLAFAPEADRGEAHYLRAFEELCRDSINMRLRADVPLGVFLSGGLDSSAVVALLNHNPDVRLKTFSVAYDFGKDYDETPHARKVAAHFKTEHHQYFMTPEEFRDSVPKYVWHMDEPVTQPAAIALYHIAKLARQHVTVVLSGEGADEILGGYDIYNYMRALEWYRRVPSPLRALASSALIGRLGNPKLSKYDSLARLPLEKRYFGVDFYERPLMEAMLAEPYRTRAAGAVEALAGRFYDPGIRSPLNRMLDFDTKTWLVDNLLMKADKMCMAPSLELRCPFLDYRLVEFCATLPLQYKIRGLKKKYLLKKSMEGKLPESIVERKKVGFPTPLKTMFRTSLREYVHDMLGSRSFAGRGYFDNGCVQGMLADHDAGRRDYHRELWQLVVLEQWFRTFADADHAAG